MLDGPGGTDCNVPVRSYWVSRDVIVAAVFDCVKECMGFVMYLIIEHCSQFHQDRQALKMMHMASKSFC